MITIDKERYTILNPDAIKFNGYFTANIYTKTFCFTGDYITNDINDCYFECDVYAFDEIRKATVVHEQTSVDRNGVGETIVGGVLSKTFTSNNFAACFILSVNCLSTSLGFSLPLGWL